MRFSILPLLGIVAVAACTANTAKDAQRTVDANAPATEPAVISVPKKIPALEAAKADTPSKGPSVIPADPTQRMIGLSQGYSFVAATMVNSDQRMLRQLYAADATLGTPDSTVKGVAAIAQWLVTLAKTKSLTDFQRSSRGTRILDDSTLADSGTYVMVFKRTPKDSVLERGTYAAHWRVRTDATKWVILEDHLKPAKGGSKKSAK